MENQRLFLWLGFLFVVFLIYQAWVTDHAPPPTPPPTATAPAEPLETAPASDDLPDVPELPDAPEAVGGQELPQFEDRIDRGRRVRVVTDVFDLEIDTLGGDLRQVDLPEYPLHKNEPDIPVRLLDDTAGELFVFQSGLRSVSGGPEPNHQVVYSTEAAEYVLRPGDDRLTVSLLWADGSGLASVKRYTFERGTYRIQLEHELVNQTPEPWTGAPYVQLKRRHLPVDRSFTSVESYSYRGPVFYDGRKYDKLDVDDLRDEPLSQTVQGGWYASIQHHFLAAAIPDPATPVAYAGRVQQGDVYLLSGIAATPQTVEPGATAQFETTLFVGPKLQSQLEDTARGLKLTVDYGFLTLIAQPLFWVLSKVHGLVGNWGWSIIILTILIKLAFYKLSETSGHSMAKMRKLQPRMKQLQERYKDDRQQLSRAMMDLYKREGANPMAGCLPILVQMPVFIALYWVLIESVELRQAPFALWIDDLSARDPFFILPVLMGVTMLVQQKLNPAPPDPVQARVMMVLPIVFTVFFAFFPAGLVLYWFVNNLLSILQQWRINTVVERSSK